MEYLPEEMVLRITQYLTEKDLAACCAVSRAWRDIFNVDLYWKRRCDLELVQYLKNTKCVVEPNFVTPEILNSGLKGVCEWRLNYMRQNHLYNNWRLGRHKTFQIPKGGNLVGFQMEYSMFYGCDCVVIYIIELRTVGSFEGKVQLWKVTSNPFLLSEFTIPLTNSTTNVGRRLNMFVTGDLVVLLGEDIVNVLSITGSHELQFKHAFHITHSEKSFVPILDSVNIQEEILEYKTVVEGPILLAIFEYPYNESLLHVWNLETGVKLKEEVYEDCFFTNIQGNECSTEKKCIVLAIQPTVSGTKILIYDLTQLAFHPFCSNSDGRFNLLLYKGILVVSTLTHLDIFNIATKQLIMNVPTNKFTQISMFGNNIVFEYGHTVKFFNPTESKLIFFFQLPEVDRAIPTFSAVRDKFLLLFVVLREIFPPNYFRPHVQLKLIENKSPKVLRSLPFLIQNFIHTNTLCSKAFTSPSSHVTSTSFGRVLHFW